MRARLLPWLLVLPAFLLAPPLARVASDPYPHLAGTGWAVLGLVPLALLGLFGGVAWHNVAWPFVGALAWALVARLAAGVTDTFEAQRALLGLALLPLVLLWSASLDRRGRAVLAGLCVFLSALWTGPALVRGLGGGDFAGALGDTGSLSQAALPGAAIGAAWASTSQGRRRLVGALALGLFLVHVAAAPVLAGGHTLLAGLLLATARNRGTRRGVLAGLALLALVTPFVGMALRELATGRAPSLEGAPETPGHSLAGLAVRARIWLPCLRMVADHPLLGVGPGQFQAAFPPYRDPREIELSRHGVCAELDTEVEHAHDDWLQAFCELGLPGGLLFVLGLGWIGRTALRKLQEDEDLGLALAGLALLVNALVHAPFSGNPAAAVLAFAVFGALAGTEGAPSAGRLVGRLPALLLLAASLFAPALVGLGRALSAFTEANRDLALLAEQGDGSHERVAALLEERGRALRRVVDAAPKSAPARMLLARETPANPELEDAVLEVRPHAIEALEQSATQLARLEHLEEARARYHRALALSPTHPRILRNLARLELTQGDLAAGLELLERLERAGCEAADWREALGYELVLVLGLPERAARVLYRRGLEELSPEELHAHARETSSAPEGLAETSSHAAECLAQLLWARQHADVGEFELALRNYRQAAERSLAARGAGAGPAPLYALEQAAAEARVGRAVRAEALPRPGARVWEGLSPWARTTLVQLGLEEPR